MSEQPQFPSLEGKQFIYDMTIAFSLNNEQISVTPRTLIATDVIQTAVNRWEFNLSGLNGRFETCYGWSLLVDTPINRERISAYAQLRDLLEQTRIKLVVARDSIESLQCETDKPRLPGAAKNMLTEG